MSRAIVDRWTVSGLVVMLTCASLTSAARADAIPPAPEECPPGTDPRTGHAGARCVPHFCGSDVSAPSAVPCDVGSRCRDALIEVRVEPPIDHARPGYPTVAAFEGACDCPRETCQRAFVCVPDDLPVHRCAGATPPRDDTPAHPPRGGCASCAVSTRDHAAAWVTALFALALAAWARRARGVPRDVGADGSRTRTSRI
ncbi:MAG: hypothetical protein J0L92_09020 [Deltaproteobacteria bacterium]|nr:hypothetical protein [Deltaproteobacteria bacterium]